MRRPNQIWIKRSEISQKKNLELDLEILIKLHNLAFSGIFKLFDA